MEFETSLNFKMIDRFSVISGKDKDELMLEIGTLLSQSAENIAQDNNGDFWLDFSNKWKTRYLILSVSAPENVSGRYKYDIVIQKGERQSRLIDVFSALFLLLALWSGSKSFSVGVDKIYYFVCILSVFVLICLFLISGKTFGRQEVEDIKNKIQSENF